MRSNLLLRIGCLRYCVLQYHKRERKKQFEIRAAYRGSVVQIIGQITVTWATIEYMIDYLIAWYHPIKGARDIAAEQPQNFAKKMDYLNKMSRDPGFTNPEALRVMRVRAKQLNGMRVKLLHGVVRHRRPMGLDWVVTVRDFKKPGAPTESYKVTDEELRTILSKMHEFSSSISPWIAKVTGLTK